MGTANSILNSIYDEENIDRASAKVKHAAQQGNGSGSQNSNAETMPPVLEHAEENAITFVYPGFQKLTFASIRSVFDHDLGITLYDYRKPAPNVYTGAVNTKIPGNRIIEATVEFSSDEMYEWRAKCEDSHSNNHHIITHTFCTCQIYTLHADHW